MMKRFRQSEAGNVAMMTALTLGVVMLGVGSAIDMNGANSARQQLQSAVDAATLNAALSEDIKSRAKEGKGVNGKLRKTVRESLDANLPADFKTRFNVEVKGGTIEVTASHKYKTSLMSMFQVKNLPVEVTAVVPLPTAPALSVSLVVDTTSSMEGDKLEAVKTAVLDLLDTLESSDSDIRVSLVPYGQYVNVGMSNQFAPWLDTTKTQISESRLVEPNCYMRNIVDQPRVCTPTGNIITDDIIVDSVVVGTTTREEQSCTDTTYTGQQEEVCPDPYTVEFEETLEFVGCVASRFGGGTCEPASGFAFTTQ